MTVYEHTQKGTLTRILLGGGVCVAAGVAVFLLFHEPAAVFVPVPAGCILVVALALFHSLTVTVSSDAIRLRFGIGFVRKRIPIADVQSASVVRNPWYFGWGIKLIPRGWLFNVSGFGAVEVCLRNGRRYRVGSDEPGALLAAIESVMGR